MKNKIILVTICSLFLLSVTGINFLQAKYSSGGKSGKITKVKVSPPIAKVKAGKIRKFTAVVMGKGKIDKSVTWSVDGGETNGTFVSTGSKQATYKAPDSVPEGGKVKIRATSNWDTSVSGTASITILGGSTTTTTSTITTIITTTTTNTTTTTTTIPPATPGNSVNDTITISGFSFSPVNISVNPGTIITVTNKDGAGHSVTSQAEAGDFTSGSVNSVSFDTGIFTTPDKTISIPSNAVSGTVIPYFCKLHKSGMVTKNGYVTVE